ncbi:MAG: hypothetical protein H6R38_169, partial [Deltaproteobacteria bacterium]|nr:hypothetical protein [Deltaproteobacteria bacterium]
MRETKASKKEEGMSISSDKQKALENA